MTRTLLIAMLLFLGSSFMLSAHGQAAPQSNLTMVYFYFDG
jgi:hypothetical protein